MVRKGFKAWLPVACAVALMGVGCGKAKDALKEALGVDQIGEDEVNAVKAEVNWDATVGEAGEWVLHSKGIRIAENAPFALSDANIKIPMPFDLPAEGIDAAAASKGRLLLLLKKRTFKVGGKDITRFQIIMAAKFADGNLTISGEELNEHLDADQKLNKENQAGDYFLAEAKGTGGIALLKGKTQLKKNDKTVVDAPKSIVFTSSSPFMTESGSTGMFLLAVPEGSTGTGVGFKADIASLAPGTPTSTTTDITYTGLLDEYKDDVTGKASALGDEAASKASEKFDQLNNLVTTYLDAWKVNTMDLVFVQPPPKPATPPTPPETDPDPPTPSDEKPVEPANPPANPPVARGDETVNIDLGCFGKYGENNDKDSLVYGVDANSDHPGWFAMGDVRITHEAHEQIFGKPETIQGEDPWTARYLDSYTGYCLLTTGDAGYQAGGAQDEYLKPIDGKKSELWQKIKVPEEASGMKSIQVRVAFFSQEFPIYVGTQFNDSFSIKFDESTEFIAEGNLNDLAAENGAADAAVKACSSNKVIDKATGLKCGDWQSIAGSDKPENGTLFAIDKSTEAPPAKIDSHGLAMNCEADGKSKCYHGWVPPRVICKDLKKDGLYDWHGQEMTLRITVTDAGDSYFDSALAVDSIVFSDKPCSDADGMIAGDRASFVNK